MISTNFMICSWLTRCLPDKLMATLNLLWPDSGSHSFNCWQVWLRIW